MGEIGNNILNDLDTVYVSIYPFFVECNSFIYLIVDQGGVNLIGLGG